MGMTDTGIVKQISNGQRHPLDGVEGFWREDLGTVKIAASTSRKLLRLGYPTYSTRHNKVDTNATRYLGDILQPTRWQKLHWSQATYIRKYAERIGSEILIAIHTNGGGGSGCAGFHITPEGKLLADLILENLHTRLGLKIRRNKRKAWGVLRGHPVACLIEYAFHDYPADLAMLLSPVALTHMGLATGEAVDSFMEISGWQPKEKEDE